MFKYSSKVYYNAIRGYATLTLLNLRMPILMKRLASLLLLGVLNTYASMLEWQHEYETGLKMAQTEHKIFYVFIVSEHCRWCRKMEATTLQDSSVMARLASKYVLVELVREIDDYPSSLQAKMVPKHYFMMPDQSQLYSVPGYWGTEDFHSILDDVEKKYNRKIAIKEKK